VTVSYPIPHRVAIACGGTGGHLFPGLAVAQALEARGCDIELLVSAKPIDQQALCGVPGMDATVLPAVGLERGRLAAFGRALWRAYALALARFRARRPDAVLAMGGFTSVAPVLAARRLGIPAFLHESNAIPGKATRWLAPLADEVFVGFSEAAGRLLNQRVALVGTPVRAAFEPRDAGACRLALGLDPARPVLGVVGGSQGAHAINELVVRALPALHRALPQWQFCHLTGPEDADRVRAAYASAGCRALVKPFLSEAELALGAATVLVGRAGGSSLAELGAMRVPGILIPLPAAADDHQRANARAMASCGAARVIEQNAATPEALARAASDLADGTAARAAMVAALQAWHQPGADARVAARILERMPAPTARRTPERVDARAAVAAPSRLEPAQCRVGGAAPREARRVAEAPR
jgi:UDP-N-acetylglucosamine--N-acetylmuramyl-(pentapeptide) pyrophosphoryl-undecaprenol N-acetylglucosamine transferase